VPPGRRALEQTLHCADGLLSSSSQVRAPPALDRYPLESRQRPGVNDGPRTDPLRWRAPTGRPSERAAAPARCGAGCGSGDNGPDGWADAAPSSFPMPGWQGGRSFAAITRFKATTSTHTTAWRHAGTSSYHDAPFQSRMELRVNDNLPGNGNGSFTCTVEKWRLVP